MNISRSIIKEAAPGGVARATVEFTVEPIVAVTRASVEPIVAVARATVEFTVEPIAGGTHRNRTKLTHGFKRLQEWRGHPVLWGFADQKGLPVRKW